MYYSPCCVVRILPDNTALEDHRWNQRIPSVFLNRRFPVINDSISIIHCHLSALTHWKFLFNDICTRHRVTFIEEEYNCSTTETSCELLRIRTRACAPWNWNCAVHTIPFERCWTRQKGEGYAPEGRYRGEESRKREGHQGFRGFGRSACQGVKGRLYRTFTASGMGRNVKTWEKMVLSGIDWVVPSFIYFITAKGCPLSRAPSLFTLSFNKNVATIYMSIICKKWKKSTIN